MDDRQLLELAAKAAGFDDYRFGDAIYPHPHVWNPLRDDGDALRLAVKLDMIDGRTWNAPIYGTIFDECGGDWYAATRRAIVRAAAEIGKQQG